MSAVKDQATPIVRTEVPEEDRMDFLPTHAGRYFMKFEQMMFNYTSNMCPGYAGGYWKFYELSNGGWYMAPDFALNEVEVIVDSNGYSGHMSTDALGIAVTITVVNHLMWSIYEADEPQARKFSDAYYLLRDYAAEHPEAAAIYGAID